MNRLLAALLLAPLAAPAGAAISRDELKKTLDANPDLVLESLKKADKSQLFQLVIEAQQDYQQKKAKEDEERERRERDEAFKNPLKPELGGNVRARGPADAPITIVEYSDFQCPYCKRGHNNIETLRKKYGDKLRVVFKNLPLAFHPLAMPAAQMFEAVALQSPDKAWVFHDNIFDNQDKLSSDYIQKIVKELGVDAAKAAKDAKSSAISEKIEADMREAKSFGIEGTPAYLINGVPLRGAYPVESFDQIIERHLKS